MFDIDAVAVTEAGRARLSGLASQGARAARRHDRHRRFGRRRVRPPLPERHRLHPPLAGRLARERHVIRRGVRLQPLKHGWSVQELAPNVTLYRQDDLRFHVLAGGNAINFVHGAVLGPSIHLIEAEKIACMHYVANESAKGLRELTSQQRAPLATAWLDHFTSD